MTAPEPAKKEDKKTKQFEHHDFHKEHHEHHHEQAKKVSKDDTIGELLMQADLKRKKEHKLH